MSRTIENIPLVKPARSRLRRWIMRTVRVLVLVYLAMCLILYLCQNVLIFPGAYVHGQKAAQVLESPGSQVLKLRTPDGHPVAAIFGTALTSEGLPRSDATSRPTILYFYGNGDCVRTSLQQFEEFRRLGCNVMIPEYIGYPMSGGKPSEAKVYATANAAYAYLLTRHDLDSRQIIIVGRSLGCAPAIDLAAREPVAGLVTFSAFTTMDEMARKVVPMMPTSLFLKAHFDNQDKIARVACPIFMAHGTADDFVPFSMMARLKARVNGAVTLYEIQGATHNDIFPVGGNELMEKFAGFVESLPHGSGAVYARPSK